MKYFYFFLYQATQHLSGIVNALGNFLDYYFPIKVGTDCYLGSAISWRFTMRWGIYLNSVCRQHHLLKEPSEAETGLCTQVVQKIIETVDMEAEDAEVELLKLLTINNEDLRGEVLVARGKLKKPGKNIVPKFIELLKIGNGKIQLRTIHTLWDMGPEAVEAAPELVTLLSPHPAPWIDNFREINNWRVHTSRRTIRFQAAAALAVISPSTPEILPVLVEMTRNWEYRWLGINSLGKIGLYAVPALPVLQRFLTSRHKAEREAAAESIAMIKQ